VKNFLTLTMLSLGVPMILMGDEVRRTQRGNNNAYCQDDETSWFDWTLLNQHADVLRFTQLLTAHRVMRDDTGEQPRISLTELLRQSSTAWHGVSLGQPDWSQHSHSLAFGAELPRAGLRMHLIMNAYWEPLDFELPAQEGEELWRRWIDTSLVSPYDISPWQEAPVCAHRVYHAAPRSVVVLWAPITGLAT
jgi:glycogen operon protein